MTYRAPKKPSFELVIVSGMMFLAMLGSASAQIDWRKDWERSVQNAKKEGKLVAGIPARVELRKQLESVFEPKFGVEMELMTARGPQNASRIAAEYQAGVRTSAS